MASSTSSHPNALSSFEAYSARYDETQFYLNSLPPAVDREPSTTNLDGAINSAANSPLNHVSEFVPPAGASPIAEPPPTESDFSPENGEGCGPRTLHKTRRVLSSLNAIFGMTITQCNKKFDDSHRPASVEAPLKYITTENVERHPKGFPQVAAFQNVDDSLLIFRSFNQVHCRVLQNLQCEIGCLERALQRQDLVDDATPELGHKLRTVEHHEGWDSAKKLLFRELEAKLQLYDDLCLKTSQLTKLRKAPKKSYQKLINFMWAHKPVDRENLELYLHVYDLVLLSECDDGTSAMTTTSTLITNIISGWDAMLKARGRRSKPLLPTSKYQPECKADTAKNHAIDASFVVGILLIPVFLLLWIRMSRFWTSLTVSFFLLVFAFVMGNFPKVKTHDVLIGTAGYCAVLATCVSNSRVA